MNNQNGIKRPTLALFALFIVLSTSSCYKMWRCECAYLDASGTRIGGATERFTSKKKAQEKCDEMKASLNASLASGESYECKLD